MDISSPGCWLSRKYVELATLPMLRWLVIYLKLPSRFKLEGNFSCKAIFHVSPSAPFSQLCIIRPSYYGPSHTFRRQNKHSWQLLPRSILDIVHEDMARSQVQTFAQRVLHRIARWLIQETNGTSNLQQCDQSNSKTIFYTLWSESNKGVAGQRIYHLEQSPY